MKQERWPDFIVIGAGKSGTTALNEYFWQHPGIFMSLRKEPNFFALESVDINSYEFEESRDYHLKSVYKKDEYLALYEGAREDQLTGEISNQYLYSDHAYLSIKKYCPDARMIAMLRQPADRLYSRYLHMVREDEVPEDGWDKLFEKGNVWWKRPDLISEGFYYQHLKKFYDNFPEGQLKVYLYDDFRADTQGVLRDMFEFINADPDAKVDTDIIVNKSGKKKDNLFNRLLGQKGLLINLSKKILPKATAGFKRNKAIVKYLNKARNKHIVSEKMSSDLRARITNEIYKEDILQLEQLLHRDLSHWMAQKPARVNS